MTVGAPTAAIALHRQASVVRTAGRPPISTLLLPLEKGLTVGWWEMGGKTQTCKSPATAAGMPPTKTVATPGPVIVPPWMQSREDRHRRRDKLVVGLTRHAAEISVGREHHAGSHCR